MGRLDFVLVEALCKQLGQVESLSSSPEAGYQSGRDFCSANALETRHSFGRWLVFTRLH